jgi:hypothetical protein
MSNFMKTEYKVRAALMRFLAQTSIADLCTCMQADR